MCWKYLQIFANFQKLLETKVSKSFHSYLTRNVCLFALLEGPCLFSVTRYAIRMELFFFYQEHLLLIFFSHVKAVLKIIYFFFSIQYHFTKLKYVLCMAIWCVFALSLSVMLNIIRSKASQLDHLVKPMDG